MKPMLAAKATVEDVHNLSYPVFVSPKLDGIRCLIINGTAVSRNLKPIPNLMVSSILAGLPAMDGELIIGPPNAPDAFNRTSSGVMRREGIPKVMYHVFDAITAGAFGFSQRLELATSYANASGDYVQPVPHKLVKSPEALLKYEQQQVMAGFEGIMIRSPDGLYKHGRSTLREGALLKLKRFEDGEARIVGFEELEENHNEQTRDELGRAKRSSHKTGRKQADTLGALVVQDLVTGARFNIGSGFSEAERRDIWSRRSGRGSVLGAVVKYRYQASGVKNKPRFPTWAGFRHEDDMG